MRSLCRTVRVLADVIFEPEVRELLIECGKSLLGRTLSRPCALLLVFLYRLLDRMQIAERIVTVSDLMIGTGTADTAVFTVQGIDEQVRRVAALDPALIIFEIAIHPLVAFHLADKYITAEQPVNVLLQTAGHRVDRTESVLDLILDLLAADIVLTHIFHQMLESNIVIDISVRIGIVDLILLRDAGADECELVAYMHLLMHINSRAHHG